jgi:uncharacterized membrane protein YdbT with pleckstrin-like domain
MRPSSIPKSAVIAFLIASLAAVAIALPIARLAITITFSVAGAVLLIGIRKKTRCEVLPI